MWTLFLHLSNAWLGTMLVWLVLLGLTPRLLLKLRRRWKTQPRRLRLVYVGLAVWMTCLPLTALELGFALLHDTTDSFDMTNVSRRWFEIHAASDVRVLEFRDGSGIQYRDDRGFEMGNRSSRRICFLGDSFTFGHGVPEVGDRFSNIVRQAADSRLSSEMRLDDLPAADGDPDSRPVDVSNLAWPGTDLFWTESVLQHIYDSDGSVDTAVYVMCLNDIEAFHDPRMTRSQSLSHFEPPTPLFRDTYFFNWLYFRVRLMADSQVRNYYDFVADYYRGESWRRFQLKLAAVNDLCRRHNTKFEVVVFPFLHNCGPDYPLKSVHQQIVQSCDELGIRCIDLEPVLSPHVDEGLTVNPFDAHPNERAHRLAGEFLAAELLDAPD